MQDKTISFIKTSQNSINSFIEKFTQKDFVNAFNLSKIPRKYKFLGKKRKDRKIDLKTYNKIVSLFFDIYYYELYFGKKQMYFFLGGMMELKLGNSGVRTIGKAVNGVRQQKYIENPLSLVWTDLWFKDFKRGEIKYIKTKGTGTKSDAIEKLWKNSNNFDRINRLKYRNKKIK